MSFSALNEKKRPRDEDLVPEQMQLNSAAQILFPAKKPDEVYDSVARAIILGFMRINEWSNAYNPDSEFPNVLIMISRKIWDSVCDNKWRLRHISLENMLRLNNPTLFRHRFYDNQWGFPVRITISDLWSAWDSVAKHPEFEGTWRILEERGIFAYDRTDACDILDDNSVSLHVKTRLILSPCFAPRHRNSLNESKGFILGLANATGNAVVRREVKLAKLEDEFALMEWGGIESKNLRKAIRKKKNKLEEMMSFNDFFAWAYRNYDLITARTALILKGFILQEKIQKSEKQLLSKREKEKYYRKRGKENVADSYEDDVDNAKMQIKYFHSQAEKTTIAAIDIIKKIKLEDPLPWPFEFK